LPRHSPALSDGDGSDFRIQSSFPLPQSEIQNPQSNQSFRLTVPPTLIPSPSTSLASVWFSVMAMIWISPIFKPGVKKRWPPMPSIMRLLS